MNVPDSQSTKHMAEGLATSVPPPTWAARRDWQPFAVRPDIERAAPFTGREVEGLKFTRWLVRSGRLSR